MDDHIRTKHGILIVVLFSLGLSDYLASDRMIKKLKLGFWCFWLFEQGSTIIDQKVCIVPWGIKGSS